MADAGRIPPPAPSATPRPTTLCWIHWGRLSWERGWQGQRDRWQAVRDGAAPPTLFSVEHDPVITLGRRADDSHLRADRAQLAQQGVTLVQADRGGEATYHGPGQLTLYAIVPLRPLGLGVSDLVRALAGAVAEQLAGDGIRASYDPARPGLWTHGRKICAVGMRIQDGVSLHGAALNVTTDLDAFRLIVPCGMPDAQTTSMAQQGAAPQPLDRLAERIAGAFARRLTLTLVCPHPTDGLVADARNT